MTLRSDPLDPLGPRLRGLHAKNGSWILFVVMVAGVICGLQVKAAPGKSGRPAVVNVHVVVRAYKRVGELRKVLEQAARDGASRDELSQLKIKFSHIVLKDIEREIWSYGSQDASIDQIFASHVPHEVEFFDQGSTADATQEIYLVAGLVYNSKALLDVTASIVGRLNHPEKLAWNRRRRPSGALGPR